MKKRRRLLVIAGMACMAAVLLSGCKKVTALSLVTDAAKNVKEVDSFKGSLDMDMEMGVAQSGISMSLNVNMSMDLEATKDPEVYHMDGQFGMDLMNLSVDMEAYGVTEGDETTVYMNIGDEWQKQTASVEDGEDMGSLLNLDAFVQGSELKLAEKTEKLDGKEVYVITTTVDGDDFNESMEGISGMMDEELMESIDFSEMSVDVTLKIFKDTKLPAAINMTLKGDSATVFEEDGMEMTLKELSYDILIEEYDTIDSIEIPKEALSATEEGGTESLLEESLGDADDTEDGDDTYESELLQDDKGNYLLMDYLQEKQVSVSTPKGFQISDYADSTYLDFDLIEDDDDYYASCYYTLDELTEYYTEDDYLENFASWQEYYTEEDDYHDVVYEDAKTIKAGNYEVKYASISYRFSDNMYVKDYYAWTVLDNNYIVECSFTETSYDEKISMLSEDSIKAAFEALQ